MVVAIVLASEVAIVIVVAMIITKGIVATGQVDVGDALQVFTQWNMSVAMRSPEARVSPLREVTY